MQFIFIKPKKTAKAKKKNSPNEERVEREQASCTDTYTTGPLVSGAVCLVLGVSAVSVVSSEALIYINLYWPVQTKHATVPYQWARPHANLHQRLLLLLCSALLCSDYQFGLPFHARLRLCRQGENEFN